MAGSLDHTPLHLARTWSAESGPDPVPGERDGGGTDLDAASSVRPLVLAVDDDIVQRELVRAVLGRAGFDVVLASDGVEAASLAVELRPDVIVTDAVMPRASGLDLISSVRSRLGNARVPTIVVSGATDITARLDAFETGADDFLAKPFEPAELVARVNAQLRVSAHFTAQANAMLAELRSARLPPLVAPAVVDDTAVSTRLDRARMLFDARPGALTCATLVLADDHGRIEWLPRPALADWTMIHPATNGLGPANPSVDLQLGARTRCPVCGAAGEGRLLLAGAGRWAGGAAYLLVGCQSPARQTHRILAEQLGDAIGLAIGDGADHHVADSAARRWIDRVIDEREFRFVFQPIVTISTRRVVGYEALVRFDGLDPLEVLDLASRAGRRVSLELALVEGALEAARVFQPGTWIHVNASPLAALAPELAGIVAAANQHVVLEITENALFDADGASSLRASLPANCRLAIDDVGAGYAGLSRLLEVRPDIVKIDRGVITGIDRDPARQALVAGLVQFGCVTDAMVIAEGIETEPEREVLRQLGVRFAQGYLFAHPGAPDAASLLHRLPQHGAD